MEDGKEISEKVEEDKNVDENDKTMEGKRKMRREENSEKKGEEKIEEEGGGEERKF